MFDFRHSFRRVIWFVITLAFFVISIDKVYESTVRYLNYPFSTSITRRHVGEMMFPAVSFCNMNDLRMSVLNGTNLDHILTHNKSLLDTLDENDMKILNKTPHKLDQMLAECVFNSEPCSHTNFSEFFSRDDRCFTFNSGKPGHRMLSAKGAGFHKGLMLTINIQHFDYYRDVSISGIRLILHGQNDTPVRLDGFHIPTGFSTHIQIDRKKTINLKEPYKTKCGSHQLSFFSQYSKDTCWLEQLTDYVLFKCNCRLHFMPGDQQICDGLQTKNCSWPAWEYFDTNRLYDCPLPCEQEIFHADSISRSLFPSQHYAQELVAKMKKGDVLTKHDPNFMGFMRSNFLRVILFYEELSYEMQIQTPSYDLNAFLGDIGGQIGLFVGAGVISYFEIIDFFVMAFYTRYIKYFKADWQKTE